MRDDVQLVDRPSARLKNQRPGGRPPFECIALLLQGGGALGSYQAGVYEALAEAPRLRVFMKLSALALSYGLPRRLHGSAEAVIGKELAINLRGVLGDSIGRRNTASPLIVDADPTPGGSSSSATFAASCLGLPPRLPGRPCCVC